ncbi:hypothetical protein D0T57_15480, partial [Dysgonomonas sp. 511]|nr:hypothetical protein [Dysgonomonas sp. 511]
FLGRYEIPVDKLTSWFLIKYELVSRISVIKTKTIYHETIYSTTTLTFSSFSRYAGYIFDCNQPVVYFRNFEFEKPFQMFAAEWLNAEALAGNLNRLNLPGIYTTSVSEP